MLWPCVRPFVCLSSYKWGLYRNDWTNRACFWYGGFLPPIPDCVVRKFEYLQTLAAMMLAVYTIIERGRRVQWK